MPNIEGKRLVMRRKSGENVGDGDVAGSEGVVADVVAHDAVVAG